ncbi:MAG: hypothetical protein COC05_07080 [Gammaproteobacteria bacterium]|nr:CDP-glycerol glycerophosphotransferase family protein [Beggiatoa alba]PCH59398.1 MAG: hypothetical protein COC05_07080 [Gammaproteobacteria bacterium]
MKKVGFLFLNTIAHAMHMATIAFQLATKSGYLVTLYVSTEELKDELEKLSTSFPDSQFSVEFLYPSRLQRLLRLGKNRHHPRVRYVIKNNLQTLLQQDTLVTTDKYNHMLGSRKTGYPLYIAADHGAGDRACGFEDRYKNYDYILISGKAKMDRMLEKNLVTPEKGRMIGYPKFDITFQSEPESFFNNDNPVVVYNPHCKYNETSWHRWGRKIIEYFIKDQRFNLIFAPHVLLFQKNKDVPLEYYRAKNIKIDLHSERLSDMSYTKPADIYLGDVSSQVYEFIGYKSRPCIFLNTHKRNWKNNENFRMWKMGDVVNDLSALETILMSALKNFNQYEPVQNILREETFSLTSEPAGERGARAIVEILESHQAYK